MAVDVDTKKYLEEVKKGKPRRFVMICKGVKILSLIVFKKGTVEKYKKQARAEGKGQFYHGVVDGKGANISFKLLRSDGFERPPGKELILKDFLNTQAGIKFKPVYEIVESLPDVDLADVEDELEPESAAAVEPEAEEPSPAPEAGGPSLAELAETFKQRLAELIPQIKQVAGSPEGDEAKLRASEAGTLARKQDFPGALEMLDRVAQLLRKATAPATDVGASGAEGSAEFVSRLKALKPDIDRVVGAGIAESQEVKLRASEAGTFARKGDFAEGLRCLTEVEALVRQGLAGLAQAAEAPTERTFSLAKLSKVRLEWIQARTQAMSEVERLRQTLAAKYANEPEEETTLAAALAELQGVFLEVNEELADELDKAINAQASERPPLLEEALGTLKRFSAFVDADPLMNELDGNEVLPDLSVRAPLQQKLQAIQAALV